jgi:UV DNA damage repair endonuclease
MIIRSIREKGITGLKEKIKQNLKDILTMMDWNELNGIKVFRLSSELFPHKSNPKVQDYTERQTIATTTTVTPPQTTTAIRFTCDDVSVSICKTRWQALASSLNKRWPHH